MKASDKHAYIHKYSTLSFTSGDIPARPIWRTTETLTIYYNTNNLKREATDVEICGHVILTSFAAPATAVHSVRISRTPPTYPTQLITDPK